MKIIRRRPWHAGTVVASVTTTVAAGCSDRATPLSATLRPAATRSPCTAMGTPVSRRRRRLAPLAQTNSTC